MCAGIARNDRLTLAPTHLWRADERYLVVVGSASTTAAGDAVPGVRRFTFTTQTAPVVTEFQVNLAGEDAAATASPLGEALEADLAASTDEVASLPAEDGTAILRPAKTATAVSASSAITIAFSTDMDEADVAARFAIAPEVGGDLSWSGGNLTFTPSERLKAGLRYTISLSGAHDALGNALGSTDSFSFVVQPGAQLTKTTPDREAADTEPTSVAMWFSQPMDVKATNEAFALIDTISGQPTGGHLVWNEARTQITFTPDVPLAGARSYRVVLDKAARDEFGNAVRADWSFTTRAGVLGVPTVRSGTLDPQRSVDSATRAGHEPGRVRAEPGQRGTRGIWIRSAGARRQRLGRRRVPRVGPGERRATSATRSRREHARDAPGARRSELRLVRREPVLPRWPRPAGHAQLVPRPVHEPSPTRVTGTTSATS